MAGLLSTPSYKDPRASILMGGGNSKITDDQIRAFAHANANDPVKILAAALANNVSISQYAKAVGSPEDGVRAYVTQQGINLNSSSPTPSPATTPPPAVKTPPPAVKTPPPAVKTPPPVVTAPPPVVTAPPPVVTAPPPVVLDKIDAPKPVTYNTVAPPPAVTYNTVAPPPAVTFTPAPVSTTRVNPNTDTIQGQIKGLLSDPNNPLMVSAITSSDQGLGRRGLLNASLRNEHAIKAMVDKAIDIAAPDAATYSGTARENTAALNQGAMFNSQYGLQASNANADNALRASMFNSENQLKAGMFNSENQLKAGMFNSDNQLKTGMFNADNLFRTNSFNSDLSSRLGMFNADTASKVGIFNAGTAADILNRREANATSILNNRESLAGNLAIANLDVESKRQIAELQFRSEQMKLRGEDTKLATSILDTMADRIAKRGADDRIPAEAKKRMDDFDIEIAGKQLDLLESINVSGVGQMLTGFKSSAQADQSTTENAEDEKPVTQNINGNPVTKTDVQIISQLNQQYGTDFKPEQIVANNERQAILNDPVYQNNPALYMQRNGITEYAYTAKDGDKTTYPIWLWT